MFLMNKASITYFVMMLWLCPIQVMGDNITQFVNNGLAVVNKNGTVILGVTQYDYDLALKEVGGLKEVLDQLLEVIGKKIFLLKK